LSWAVRAGGDRGHGTLGISLIKYVRSLNAKCRILIRTCILQAWAYSRLEI